MTADDLEGVVWVGPAARSLPVPQVEISGPGRGALLADALTIRRAGVQIALVAARSPRLRDTAAACTLGGVLAVVGFLDAPLDGPGSGPPGTAASPLPPRWWHRRIHRFACADADTARSWGRAGIALGRIVVIPLGPHEREALEAVVREVRSMGG